MSEPTTSLSTDALADQLIIIRDHYVKAIELARAGHQQSSAIEEATATRKLHRLFLHSFHTKPPIQNH